MATTIPRLVFTNGGRRLVTVGGRSLVGRRPPGATLTVTQWTIPNEGSPAVARVSIDRTLLVPVVVTYETSNGTATAGTDYTSTTGSTSITAGQTYVDVSVPTTLRSGAQSTRAFTFTVTAATAAGEDIILGVPASTMSILDTTTPPATTVEVANKTIIEGTTAQVRVSRSAANAVPVTFTYATSNGTATSGTDYTSTGGTGTIPADATYVDIPVLTTLRGGAQASRAFTFTISAAMQGATSLTITDASATVTILDSESSAHAYYETLRALPEKVQAWSLRRQEDLDENVLGRVENTPAMIAAGAPAYYDAVKVSRSWQYVYPDADASSIHNGGNPNGTDAGASAGTWAPKDAARLYIDSSNTSTSPYYDPAVPVLEKKPWHYTPCNPRPQSLYFPLNISSGRILVVVDKWHARGWRHGRTEFRRQIKPFRFLTTRGDFWGAAQVSDWPQSAYAATNGVAYTAAWGTMRNLFSSEVSDYSTTTANKPAGHSTGDPVSPTGQGALPVKQYNYPWEVWVRHIFEIRMFEPHTAFTSWNAAAGVTLQANPQDASGRWHMMSHWALTETSGPHRLLYQRPWFTDAGRTMQYFNFNYHTSQDWPTMTGPLVAYARNLVVLHNYTLPATPEDDTLIFERPVP